MVNGNVLMPRFHLNPVIGWAFDGTNLWHLPEPEKAMKS
jgi:hypothetical protein